MSYIGWSVGHRRCSCLCAYGASLGCCGVGGGGVALAVAVGVGVRVGVGVVVVVVVVVVVAVVVFADVVAVVGCWCTVAARFVW